MYVHEDNLNKKISEATAGSAKHTDLVALKVRYDRYRSVMESIDYERRFLPDYLIAADAMNGYLIEVDNVMRAHSIKAQTKLRSTVLEELSVYLFERSPIIVTNGMEFYNKYIYAGVLVKSDLQYKILHKDVDFCIGKTSTLSIAGVRSEVRFPFVCVEAKTYVDATMNHEVLFSGTQLKTASPDVHTYVLMEYQDEISEDAPIPASYSYAIDKYFTLRECKRPNTDSRRELLTPIKGELLLEYYSYVVDHL